MKMTCVDKMRVVHIATTDFGGAALGLLNLHEALLSLGVESKVLVAQKTTNMDSVVCMEPNHNLFHWSSNKLIRKVQKIMRRRGKLLTKVEQWDTQINKASDNHKPICFTSPFTCYDIAKHPLVIDADIVHLHWVGNFLDYPSFFYAVNKPIVWTLRDENPGLGGFHYTSDKNNFDNYYNNIEETFLETKRKVLLPYNNLTLIALSDVMRSFCTNVDYLKNKKVVKIYNPIDGTHFNLIGRKNAREALGIPGDSLIISFVSVSLKDHRKGLSQLIKAIKLLNKPVKLLCVGINDFFTEKDSDIVCYGLIENTQLLSLIYSASDVFVTLSSQESFGKTTIEAMLCGTPVISTATGIAPEVIDEDSGSIINDVNPQEIAFAINKASQRDYNGLIIREKAIRLFDPKNIAQQHKELYSSLIRDVARKTNNY